MKVPQLWILCLIVPISSFHGKLNHYLLNLNPFPSPIQLGLNYIFSFTFLNCKQGVSRICSFFLLFNWTVTKEINHYEIRNLSNSVKGPRISCFPVELLTPTPYTWLRTHLCILILSSAWKTKQMKEKRLWTWTLEPMDSFSVTYQLLSTDAFHKGFTIHGSFSFSSVL